MPSDKEKFLDNFYSLLNEQDFENEEEIHSFMNDVMNSPLAIANQDELTDEQKAQGLVFDAWETNPEEGREMAREALELYPGCIEAYEYLGDIEKRKSKAKVHYLKGIETGRELFGGEFMEKNKGHFWGIIETRPFMRCLLNYTMCLNEENKTEEAVSIYEEMIGLNPADDQGARFMLGLKYLQLNYMEKVDWLNTAYGDDVGTFQTYNLALYQFKKHGRNKETDFYLRLAILENEFVIPKLIQKKSDLDILPEDIYSLESEAQHYALHARKVWRNTLGAVAWLKKMS